MFQNLVAFLHFKCDVSALKCSETQVRENNSRNKVIKLICILSEMSADVLRLHSMSF